MCEIIPPLEVKEKSSECTTLTQMQELDLALEECKFGRFHIRLLISVFVRNIVGSIVSGTTPYLLTSAECDLNMSLVQKGLLNSMPFVGMTFSITIAGFLTDAFGRRVFVVNGLGCLFVVMIISGCSQTYEMLATAKFLEGAIHGTAHSAAVTITAEFCYKSIRDRMMLCQSAFAALSQVAVAAMSWGLLMQDWRYSLFSGYVVLNTWNIYLLGMALWGLVACILYLFMPESPKFLLTRRRYSEVREILINIYKENTGKPANTFQYADLWKDLPRQEGPKESPVGSLSHHLVVGLRNVKPMFKKPLILYLLLFCMMNLQIMSVYNVIRLWFPQLFTIVEHYDDKAEDLCVMLDAYTQDLKTRAINSTGSEVCVRIKSGTETYVNSIILGFVAFIPYCIQGIIVNKVGKRTLMKGLGLMSVGATLALRWASSRIAVVSLFSLDSAIMNSMMSLTVVSSVEIFPTVIRSFATSIIMMVGRFGTLVGNVSFPILLNMGCVVPFFTMTGIVVCVLVLTFFLPIKK